MKLIIDIPEELYKANIRGLEAEEVWDLRIAIKNGTPLPKGHGRLKDVDELYNSLEFPTQQFASAFKQVLDDAPTIIEADTESEGEE